MPDQISFTTINHIARKKLGLSMMQYALADLIYHLSNNPKSVRPGWCYANRELIADILDTTERHVYRLINELIELGLIDRNDETKDLRASSKWYETVMGRSIRTDKLSGKVTKSHDKMSPSMTKSHVSMTKSHDKMSGPINVDNNKSENNKIYTGESLSHFLSKSGKTYPEINLIGESEVQEIAKKYSVTHDFVWSCLDQMIYYCKSSGKSYQDYFALLHTFVIKKMDSTRTPYKAMSKKIDQEPDQNATESKSEPLSSGELNQKLKETRQNFSFLTKS